MISERLKTFYGKVKEGLGERLSEVKLEDIAKFGAKKFAGAIPIVGPFLKDIIDEFSPDEKGELIKELKELSESQFEEISAEIGVSVEYLEGIQKFTLYTFKELRADHEEIKELLLHLIEIVTQRIDIDIEEELNEYLNNLIVKCRRDDFLDLAPSKVSPEDFFVPLSLFEDRTIASKFKPPSEEERQDRRETYPRSPDADDVFRYLNGHQESAVILGIPGSGKTKLLRHWCSILAMRTRSEPFRTLPLLVSAMQLTQAINDCKEGGDKGLVQILAKSLYVSMELANEMFSRLKTGKVAFLVDGLDEVPPGDTRSKGREGLEAWLEDLAANPNLKIPIVVSCRKANYLHPLKFKKHFLIYGLNKEKIEHFTRLWFGNKEDIARKFMDQYQENPVVRRLVENPLLLKLACLLYSDNPQETLPLQRVKLCEKTVDLLLKEWEEEEHRIIPKRNQVDITAKKPVLEAIALQMIEEPQRELPADRLYDIVGDKKPSWCSSESPVIIEEIVNSGLLNPLYKEQYSFALPTFLEYFAARGLHQQDDWVEQISSLAQKETWHGALTFLAQNNNDAEQLSNALLQTDPLIAYDSTKEWTLNEYTQQRLMKALIQSLHSLEQHRRWAASEIIMRKLEVTPSPDEMAVIYENLPDSAYFFLTWWADKLIETGEENARNAFVHSLRVEGSFRRQISLRKLGDELGKPAKEQIRLMINSPESPEQWEAIHALGELTDRESLDLLRTVLQDESRHRLVRSEAARVLGSLGEKCDLSILQEMTKEDEWVLSYFAKIGIQEISRRYELPHKNQDQKQKLAYKRNWEDILTTSVSPRWEISEVHYGNDPRWILHVAEFGDDDWDTMWNVVEFFHYAVTELGMKYIGVEGGFKDDLDISYLRNSGTHSRRIVVALEFFKAGSIAPEEYLQLATDYEFHLMGIDDKITYNQAAEEIRTRGSRFIDSEERTDAMSRIILRRFSELKTDKIIIITTPSLLWDLAEKLKQRGLCYAEIRPKYSNHPFPRPDRREVLLYDRREGLPNETDDPTR